MPEIIKTVSTQLAAFEKEVSKYLEDGFSLHGEPHFTDFCIGLDHLGGRKYETIVFQALKKLLK